MAKKKKTTRGKKAAPSKPQHMLPAGFWAQVGAVALIVVSILYIVAWFGAGGPVLDWVQAMSLEFIGYAVYVLPILFTYLAVETFRASNNKLALMTKLSTALLVVWCAGLFGLMQDGSGNATGGWVGATLNDNVMLPMVSPTVAGFIYVVLIVITVLFVLRVSPFTVISRVWGWISTNMREEERTNKEVIKKANAEEATKSTGIRLKFGGSEKDKKDEDKSNDIAELKLKGMVTADAEEEKPKPRLSSLRGSVQQDKVAEEKQALVAVNDPNWQAPSLDLLEKKQKPADPGDVQQSAQTIKDTLSEFNIDVEMEGANVGPKVTQYTLKPPSGVKLTRITALETNIALNLAAQSLRMEAPIPGQKAVGIEVPNLRAADVRLYGILESKQWKTSTQPLSFAIGKDISGHAVVGELNKMPHLLIAGQTGSGKSVMINTLLTSLLYRNSPSQMKLILVDPKQVEMAPYEDIPHLLTPVINEPEKTVSALKWAVNEMERRYKLLAEEKVREIESYNKRLAQRGRKISVEDEEGNMQEHEEGTMPYIVIVIDELADLMMLAARDVEALIVRLAQKARAVGIHLVLATQRPSVNVITGLIKANVPARIAFTVASQVDSRTILDVMGAEKLLGQGDMLMKTAQMGKPKRVQGAWVTDEEVLKITDHLRMQSAPQYNDEIVAQPVQLNGKGGVVMDFDSDGTDDMYKDAVRVVVESKKASTSLLQRRLRIGYARAARVIEELEEQGVIGPADGARPREVLISSLDDLNSGE
ncbi:cell division protein FtsK [Candidatus Mycosynbacter amalyticus]|uniref:Cell division protein FtsK n=1 Tax=Candidatus Mycosynbacter amalyticus TaxID=2665156 RepID=A0A857MML4_9BACT|nr:DNA translocase FtsK [Candidatus Mycosynbacter amalyticus]QHN42401.1 cell division protein FtsK [Candidatus Mycosynbacter amalyticus]